MSGDLFNDPRIYIMVNGISASDQRGLNKGRSLKFRVSSPIR